MTARQRAFDRAIGIIPWILAILCAAIAIHLLAVLTAPAFWPNGAFRKLALHLPPGEKDLLARATVGAGGPTFSDPFAALAVCRFDLSQGPLRLRAAADGDHPVSVSVRLSDGAVIYSANDRQTPHGRFNVLIVTQAQADAQDAAQDNPDRPATATADDELRLISPRARGFVVFRALALREGDYDAAAAARGDFQCSVEKPAP